VYHVVSFKKHYFLKLSTVVRCNIDSKESDYVYLLSFISKRILSVQIGNQQDLSFRLEHLKDLKMDTDKQLKDRYY
jgi:hypothetical protein